jgi:hypothetical protein
MARPRRSTGARYFVEASVRSAGGMPMVQKSDQAAIADDRSPQRCFRRCHRGFAAYRIIGIARQFAKAECDELVMRGAVCRRTIARMHGGGRRRAKTALRVGLSRRFSGARCARADGLGRHSGADPMPAWPAAAPLTAGRARL